MINRCAITVRARESFLDWLNALPDPVSGDTTLEEVNSELHVYLLPDYGYDDEREGLLAQFHDIIFERELDGWWTDETDWPQERNLEMFTQWFDVEFHSIVEDLVDAPLIDED